jgi:hypothetical protein
LLAATAARTAVTLGVDSRRQAEPGDGDAGENGEAGDTAHGGNLESFRLS